MAVFGDVLSFEVFPTDLLLDTSDFLSEAFGVVTLLEEGFFCWVLMDEVGLSTGEADATFWLFAGSELEGESTTEGVIDSFESTLLGFEFDIKYHVPIPNNSNPSKTKIQVFDLPVFSIFEEAGVSFLPKSNFEVGFDFLDKSTLEDDPSLLLRLNAIMFILKLLIY
jgi:hypothetical protein